MAEGYDDVQAGDVVTRRRPATRRAAERVAPFPHRVDAACGR
jgi:hypothetical protein